MKIYEKYLIEDIEQDIEDYMDSRKDGDQLAVSLIWIDKRGKWNIIDSEHGYVSDYRIGKTLDSVLGGWDESELKGLEDPKLKKKLGAKKAWMVDM